MLALCVLGAAPSLADAQAKPQSKTPLAVYLDCRSGCDGDLIRTEISWVNWVRYRLESDVHVLVTSQGAGAGQEFTIALLGARAFAGRGDTLTYVSNATSTNDERRRGVLNTIAMGLVPFAAHTPVSTSLRISTDKTVKATNGQTTRAADKWDAWVFSVSLGGSTSGEEYYRSRNVYSRFSARRVTEAWKTEADLSHSYRDNRATAIEYDSLGTITSQETYTSLQRDWSADLLQVKSITGHLSVGGFFEVASQTFRNQDLRVEGLAAVEYSVLQYAEATRRKLLVRYGVGYTNYQYADTTIFNKIRESVPRQRTEIEYRTNQPWGGANFYGEHVSVLTDPSKRSTQVSGNFNVRVFRGFSINAGARYEWIHDQLYLPRGEQTAADVLLRRRALLTGYEYSMSVGVSYTFGSIYNNVVNPRF